ncbi:MAG: hypothetical protein KF851_06830 [Pirellulaceae bacterium]|nr:hypothetical protein [Pirellulaceae bacterium]
MLVLVRLVVVVGLVASMPLAVSAQDSWGHLSGRFVVKGELPPAAQKKIDNDAAYCTRSGKPILDETVVVDENGGLRDVFVMLLLERDAAPPTIHPSYEEKKNEPVVLDNVECRFEPYAVFVRAGQKLSLKNSDEIGHNCHIITFGNEENVNLVAGGTVEVALQKADRVPGNVVCDIHKWMEGVILVRDEPYAAITAADGTFRIDNLPAGTLKFQFWHKKVGFLREITVGNQVTGRRGEAELTIVDGETLDLGTIEIDAKALTGDK